MKFDKSMFSRMLEQVGRVVMSEPPPPDTARGRLNGARLSEFLAYRDWDPASEMFRSNTTVGFMIEVLPLIGGDDVTNSTLGDLFTHSVPNGAVVQVISYASPKIGSIVDFWAAARSSHGGIFERLAKHRRNFFRDGAWKSRSKAAPYFLRDFRVYITIEAKEEGSAFVVDQMIEAREKFISSLKAIRTEASIVGPDQMIALVADILNPTTSIQPRKATYDPDLWLNDQMVNGDTTWTVFRNRLEVRSRSYGDEFNPTGGTVESRALSRERGAKDEIFEVRGFSVRKFPDQWTQGAMSRLLGDVFNDQIRLMGPTVVTLAFRALSQDKSRSTTEFKRMRTQQAAESPFGKMFPDVGRCAENWRLVMDDVGKGARLAHMGMFVLSIAPKATAERSERSLRAVFSASSFELQRDDDIHVQTLLGCLPLSMGGGLFEDFITCGRMRRMPTTVFGRLAPMQGEFMGGGVPHVLLAGRRGQVLLWSPFDNEGNGNHNACVVGSSGSGKSVFMQELAAALRGSGAEVFVIDDGESFKNSCDLVGGENIRFNLDQATCINPFSIIEGASSAENEKEYMADAIELIRLMIEQAARGDKRCSDEERGAIEECVIAVWDEHGRNGSFSHVIQKLTEGDYGDLGDNLALALKPYDLNGSYGAFFNGPATLDITNPYTVFEMRDLDSKKDLRAVIVLAILFLISQRMTKGGKQLKKALIIDEAWQLLTNGAAGSFIEGFARRCRKEGGALITGTQSIEDYYKTDGAKACIDNSDHTVVLRLKSESLNRLQRDAKLSIDDATMSILKSLKVSDREYSELFFMGPESRFVARLLLDPYSATLYSTTAAVSEEIRAMTRNGVTLEDAVEQIAFRPSRRLAA